MSTSFENTKIVATVGPSSNTREKLLELVVAGVDVFRLNFSHGDHKGHKQVIDYINDINKTHNYSVSILQDLQGPKIRIGEMKPDVVLEEEASIEIVTTPVVGTAKKISTTYQPLISDVKAGDAILIDDGKIELRVYKVGESVHAKVVYGGPLKSRKGMNLPDTDISEPSLTKKDLEDLAFGLESDVDWIAISFVRNPNDVLDLRNRINAAGKRAKIIAKIERPEAVKHIEEIVKCTDAIMVARGDLGVEVQMEEVPMLQKKIVRLCNKYAKPVIIATQMMESMIENPRPTRAEANDVANAVCDGADAVMLSAETASGRYPVQVIQAMSNIIRNVETTNDSIYFKTYHQDRSSSDFLNEIVVQNASDLARISNAKAIIGMTDSGFTAYQLARYRPTADIFIFTSNKPLMRTLNLVWGIRAFHYHKVDDIDDLIISFEKMLCQEGLLRKDDIYINIGALPVREHLRTNMIKISQVK